jgi:polyisoprenoid-binding protein YceI
MKKQLATLILAIAAAAPALAAPETFNLDNNHTFPRFSYSHLGYTIQMSRFDKVTGAVVLDKAAKTGKVDIVIDTKSVNTGSKPSMSTSRAKTSSTPPSTRPPPSNPPRSCLKATSRAPLKAI